MRENTEQPLCTMQPESYSNHLYMKNASIIPKVLVIGLLLHTYQDLLHPPWDQSLSMCFLSSLLEDSPDMSCNHHRRRMRR